MQLPITFRPIRPVPPRWLGYRMGLRVSADGSMGRGSVIPDGVVGAGAGAATCGHHSAGNHESP